MKMNVQALIKVVGASEEVNVSGTPELLSEGFQGYQFVKPLEFHGQVVHVGNGMLELNGHMTMTVEAECSRCLKPVQRTLEVELTETFQSVKHRNPGFNGYDAFGIEEEEDDSIYMFDGVTLDLSDALKDQAILALPSRELCKPDCAGLCPSCGRHKEDPLCQCTPEDMGEADEDQASPFAQLKQLL